MDASASVLVERDGHVVTITLNRPEARNALDLQMLARLADAWDTVDNDPEVRCVILTGAGGHFCSGSDLKQMHNPPQDEWSARFKTDPDLHWKAFLRHRRLAKPLIAAVEGYAIAGGTEILQATDIRVAGEGSTFGVTEAKWSLYPQGGSVIRLRRQIPYTKAMEMLLTADMYPAEEALAFGLIGRIVPKGQALAVAQQLADKVAANGPVAVQKIKEAVIATECLPEKDALDLDFKIGQQVYATQDAREGPKAFKEKRTPNFTGK